MTLYYLEIFTMMRHILKVLNQNKRIIALHLTSTKEKADDFIDKVIKSLENNKNDLFVGFFKESGKYNFFNANNELGFYIDDDFYSQTNFKAELEFRKKSPFVYITYFKTSYKYYEFFYQVLNISDTDRTGAVRLSVRGNTV